MVKIVTSRSVHVSIDNEQTKKQQIFTANTENSVGKTGTSKSVGV